MNDSDTTKQALRRLVKALTEPTVEHTQTEQVEEALAYAMLVLNPTVKALKNDHAAAIEKLGITVVSETMNRERVVVLRATVHGQSDISFVASADSLLVKKISDTVTAHTLSERQRVN